MAFAPDRAKARKGLHSAECWTPQSRNAAKGFEMQRKRMSHNGYAATVETTLDEHGYRAEVTCDDGWIASGRAPTAIGARRLVMRAARVAGMRVDTSIQDEIDDARTAAFVAAQFGGAA